MAKFMSKNPVLEAIKSRRAVRSYEDRPVPESAVETMLEAATYAPSAINVQPWKFTIVTNKAEMKLISETSKQALLKTLPDVTDEELVRFKNALKNPQYNLFYDAPLTSFHIGLSVPVCNQRLLYGSTEHDACRLYTWHRQLLDRNSNPLCEQPQRQS